MEAYSKSTTKTECKQSYLTSRPWVVTMSTINTLCHT